MGHSAMSIGYSAHIIYHDDVYVNNKIKHISLFSSTILSMICDNYNKLLFALFILSIIYYHISMFSYVIFIALYHHIKA